MPAVEAGAKLYAAGENNLGECGVDPEAAGHTVDYVGKHILQPVPVSGLGALAGAAVQQIAQGCGFTLLRILGRLYHAGSNEYGERGNGRTDEDPHPDFAEIPLPALAVEVVCGSFFALVLLENGIVLSCERTLIPRPWVPCPGQGGMKALCAFYVRAASESDGWACAQCTFANTPAAAQCEMCSAPRPAGDSAAPAPGHGALCVGAPSPSPPSPTPSGGAAGAATIAPPIVRHADGTAAGTAAPRTLAEAVARFFSRYAVTRPAKRVEQVDNWVKDILVDCSELPGAGPLEEFLEMYEELRKAVDAKPPSTDAHPVAARAARFWTAGDLPQGGMHGGPSMNATYKGREIEFCTWVGHAVCFGNEELLERVVPYLRTLNLFCVTRRGGHDMAPVWEKLRSNSWRLYRGSGFDAAHRDWYRPGLVFRQLRAVASSLKRDTALDFAMRGFENGEWPVLWVIEIDSEPPHCHHVNHLGPGISFYPTEDEFLFPNASVFTVVRVEWQEERRGDRPSLIVLRAARDNRQHPTDLPVAPRS